MAHTGVYLLHSYFVSVVRTQHLALCSHGIVEEILVSEANALFE